MDYEALLLCFHDRRSNVLSLMSVIERVLETDKIP